MADPFVGVVPPAPPPAPVVAAAPAPPPAPVPPPLNYRFLGRVIDPDGKSLVYLVKGERHFPVSTGTQLDEGYRVERVTASVVELYFPALDYHTKIEIPLADTQP